MVLSQHAAPLNKLYNHHNACQGQKLRNAIFYQTPQVRDILLLLLYYCYYYCYHYYSELDFRRKNQKIENA